MEEEIGFILYNNIEYKVEIELIKFYCNKIYKLFNKTNKLQLTDNFSNKSFQAFIDFIHNQRTIISEDIYDEVLQILEKWNCLRLKKNLPPKTQSINKNNELLNNNFKYNFNTGLLIYHSQIFHNYFTYNPNQQLVLKDNFPEDTFLEFLELIHNNKEVKKLQNPFLVYQICLFYNCNNLIQLFDIKDPKFILQLINNSINDCELEKKYVSENIDIFLQSKQLYLLNFPFLIQIFQQIKTSFQFSKLFNFLNDLYNKYQLQSFLIFNYLLFEIDNKELFITFLSKFSTSLTNYFKFQNIHLEELIKENKNIKNEKDQLEILKQKLNEKEINLLNLIKEKEKLLLNNEEKIKEFEKKNKNLNDEIILNKKQFSEKELNLSIKIKEKDNLLSNLEEKVNNDLFNKKINEIEYLNQKKIELYLLLSSYNLFNNDILNSFLFIKREDFVLENDKINAYENRPFSIGYNQTISQPYTIAFMLNYLDVKKGQNILEVGSGCGYVLCLLSYIVGDEGKIFGIDIVEELVEMSKKNIKNKSNIEIYHKSGIIGLPDKGKFDRILISSGCTSIPDALISQLVEGGKLVVPIHPSKNKIMTQFTKINNKLVPTKNEGTFSFVPFIYS